NLLNGLIMVYYHAQGETPSWEIPELPEYSAKEWMPLRPAYYQKLHTHVQELGEQFPDIAHIKFLHSDEFVKSNAPTIDGIVWSKFFWTKQSFTTRGVGLKNGTQAVSNSQIETQYEITFYGLGYNQQKYCTKAMFEFNFLVLALLTPIDKEYIDVRLVISAKKLFNSFITAALTSLILKVFKKEFEKDIPILSEKLHHLHPILCEGDGEIMQYRRWASQFYSEEPATAKA
uniref:hypothetical protein n=1 Tax=Calothrix rhizosoleniae TaxID=888997 RepID=UPI001F3FD086